MMYLLVSEEWARGFCHGKFMFVSANTFTFILAEYVLVNNK